jgi:leucyl aminopeptidase
MWNPYYGRSPGADDDGSGTTTVIETLTILINSGYTPTKRVLEFHFYAAEEGGLLGSQKVVESYMKDKKDVYAVLHSDMTGYQPDGKSPFIAVARDNVDKALTDVLVMLTGVYSDLPAVMTKCG